MLIKPILPLSSILPTVPNPVLGEAFKFAKQHAPVLQFDKHEPFLPLAAGYTLFKHSGPSASFKRDIILPENCSYAIEYAIWWDWDIQHLYELEHLWVYLNDKDELIFAEGSFHGGYHALETSEGKLPKYQDRLQAYSESGKHAFASSPEQLQKLRPFTANSCKEEAGKGDVLINHMFEDKVSASPAAKRSCKRFMKAHAFEASFEFDLQVDLQSIPLVSWQSLKDWIPKRLNAWLELLEQAPKLEAVFLDCGDTLIDEGTELKDEKGVVLSADCIEGAKDLLAVLKDQGYRVALVADGLVQSFKNIFDQHNFSPYFEVEVISEAIGVDKPDKKMFLTTLQQLDLASENNGQVVMVGNNLPRDIKGANDLGIMSIWLDWAPRRSKIPADASEVPDYSIKLPLELIGVLEQIELDFMASFLPKLSPPASFGLAHSTHLPELRS